MMEQEQGAPRGPHAQVGAGVRAARVGAGLTQEQLARKMRERGHRWDRHQVSRVEQGHRELSTSALVALARALDVTVGALVGQ